MMSRVTAAGRSSRTSQVPHHEVAHGGVVVHHQDQRLLRFIGDLMRSLRAILPTERRQGRFCALRIAGQADGEDRALPRLAFDGDVAAHHAAEMLADGETEAGATVFAGGRRVRLGKLLEQPAHLLFGHADPGIRHGHRDHVAAIEPLWLRRNGHGAFLGELVGVAGEVEKRLPESGLIGVHGAEVRRAIDHDLVGVLRGHRLYRLGDVLNHRRQRERFEVKLHATRLDLRQVEDIVDQREQVAGSA